MGTLLKNVAKGLLYLIIAPVFIVTICVVGVFGIFGLLYLFVKSIYLFFSGRSLNDDLPEDKLAKAVKEGKNVSRQDNVSNQTPLIETTKEEHNNITIEEAVFGHPIYTPFESVKEENIEPVQKQEELLIQEEKEEPHEEEIILSREPISEPESITSHSINIEAEQPSMQHMEVKEEKIEYYKESKQVLIDEDEDEEEDSGVTISFGGDRDV